MKKAKLLKGILIFLILAVLVVGCYCAYILLSYHRIGDMPLSPENGTNQGKAASDTEYTVVSYNIGFGAYQQNYTCVMDSCYMPTADGGWEEVKGKNLKALSRDDAMSNTQGAADTIAALNPDFALLQEVDTKSDRCYHIDQTAVIKKALGNKNSVFCVNFKMPFLAYPLNDMMGSVESGLLTVSRFNITAAERHEFEVTSNIIDRLFDLDRCFSASFIDVDNGKQLVLINLHMSAYDEGGVIREKQRKQLYSFIEKQYAQGKYIIIGGDFNHDLLTNNPAYPEYTSENIAFSDRFTQKLPDNIVFFFDENKQAGLPDGFRVIAADNVSTCRPAAIEWQPGFSFVQTFDGFIVSDNVKVNSIKNVETSTDQQAGFAYSDHDPALMHFVLAK